MLHREARKLVVGWSVGLMTRQDSRPSKRLVRHWRCTKRQSGVQSDGSGIFLRNSFTLWCMGSHNQRCLFTYEAGTPRFASLLGFRIWHAHASYHSIPRDQMPHALRHRISFSCYVNLLEDAANLFKASQPFLNFAFVYSTKIPASRDVAVRGGLLVHSLGEAHSGTQPRLMFLRFVEGDLLSTDRSAGLPRCQPYW